MLKNKTHILAPTVFFILLALSFFSQPRYSDFNLVLNNGKVEKVTFPYGESSRQNTKEIFELEGSVDLPFASTKVFQIIPDDELLSMRVNGKKIPLTQVSRSALKDYRKGFHFDFSSYLKVGSNKVYFRFL